jgi:hypothetical protein
MYVAIQDTSASLPYEGDGNWTQTSPGGSKGRHFLNRTTKGVAAKLLQQSEFLYKRKFSPRRDEFEIF